MIWSTINRKRSFVQRKEEEEEQEQEQDWTIVFQLLWFHQDKSSRFDSHFLTGKWSDHQKNSSSNMISGQDKQRLLILCFDLEVERSAQFNELKEPMKNTEKIFILLLYLRPWKKKIFNCWDVFPSKFGRREVTSDRSISRRNFLLGRTSEIDSHCWSVEKKLDKKSDWMNISCIWQTTSKFLIRENSFSLKEMKADPIGDHKFDDQSILSMLRWDCLFVFTKKKSIIGLKWSSSISMILWNSLCWRSSHSSTFEHSHMIIRHPPVNDR